MDVIDNPPQEKVLSNQYGEQYLFSINGDLFSKNSASMTYQSIFNENLWNEETYHIIAGTDSGLLIEYIVNHGIPDNSCYLFIELPEYIEMIRPQLDEQWQDKLKFCTPQEWAVDFDKNYSAAYFYNDNVLLHYSAAVCLGRNERYHRMRLSVDYVFKNKQYENNVAFGNRDFINAQLLNVVHNNNSSQLLSGAFEGKTCVILGGGPSLDTHLEWVSNNKENLIIIAVSRISKKLQGYGLVPHIVCAIDPQQISFDVSKEMYNYPKEVLLLNGYHVIPKLVSQWGGKSVYYGDRLPWESELNAKKHFHEGPTVVNAALIAAVDMGFKQILLTGTDLAYGNDGKTHATGSFEASREIEISRDSQWLETYSGDMAETIVPLILTGKYLSKHAKYAEENGSCVYNLSPNALKIDHIQYREAESFELEKLDEITATAIDRLVPENTLETTKIAVTALTKEFVSVKKDLAQIKALANEAIVATHKAFSSSSSEKQKANNCLKIDKVERKLTKKYAYLNTILKTLAFKGFAKILMGGAAKDLDEQALSARNITYYRSYELAVKLMSDLLEPASQRLALLSHSCTNKPDIAKLCDYWIENQESGCGTIYKSQQEINGIVFNEDDTLLFSVIVEKQKAYQKGIDHAYSQITFTLDGVAIKIRQQFRNKDAMGLGKIIEFLQASGKEEQSVKDHVALAVGYLNILKESFDVAYESLLSVSSSFISTEDAEQLVYLMVRLEKFEEAEERLAILCDSSTRLKRTYGQVLAQNGKNEQAIEAYSSFLETFNTQSSAWCELAQLFITCGVIESAKMAYEFVLSIEPNHEIAKRSIAQINDHLASQST